MAENINLQVKLKGDYADTYRRFAENNPECETHREKMTAILRTLPEYQAAQVDKNLAGAKTV